MQDGQGLVLRFGIFYCSIYRVATSRGSVIYGKRYIRIVNDPAVRFIFTVWRPVEADCFHACALDKQIEIPLPQIRRPFGCLFLMRRYAE